MLTFIIFFFLMAGACVVGLLGLAVAISTYLHKRNDDFLNNWKPQYDFVMMSDEEMKAEAVQLAEIRTTGEHYDDLNLPESEMDVEDLDQQEDIDDMLPYTNPDLRKITIYEDAYDGKDL